MSIDDLVTIDKLFQNRVFRIPDYQRGYSWARLPHLEDFWNDVMSLDQTEIHYTGAITTERPNREQLANWRKESELFSTQYWGRDESKLNFIWNGETATPLYIVDGQQRLLTIAILLSTIVDSKILDVEESDQIRKQYLLRNDYDNHSPFYYLGYEVDLPSHSYLINKIFRGLPSDEVETAYTKNLLLAKTFFETEIRDFTPEEMRGLVGNVTTKLKFDYRELDDSLDASIVFETMNNRGKPLSKLELLKNRLLYLASQLRSVDKASGYQLKNTINDAWRHLYEWLAKKPHQVLNDDDFLRSHWIMYFNHEDDTETSLQGKDFARDLMLTQFHERSIRKSERTASDISQYVTSLKKSVEPWFYINYPGDSSEMLSPAIARWLDLLNQLRSNSFFRPIIMALLQGPLGENYRIDLLRSMERHDFLVKALAGSRANANRPYFWRQANEFYLNQLKVNDLIRDINRKAEKFYSQNKFQKNMGSHHADNPGENGGWAAWKHIKYFMREYEYSLSEDMQEEIILSRIEPIYPGPSASSSDWKKAFAGYTQARMKTLTSSLGNLVYIAKRDSPQRNSTSTRARKKVVEPKEPGSFGFKKSHLVGAGFYEGYFNGSAAEREIAKYEKWNHQAVLDRGVILLRFMSDRWDISLNESFCRTMTQVNFDVK